MHRTEMPTVKKTASMCPGGEVVLCILLFSIVSVAPRIYSNPVFITYETIYDA